MSKSKLIKNLKEEALQLVRDIESDKSYVTRVQQLIRLEYRRLRIVLAKIKELEND